MQPIREHPYSLRLMLKLCKQTQQDIPWGFSFYSAILEPFINNSFCEGAQHSAHDWRPDTANHRERQVWARALCGGLPGAPVAAVSLTSKSFFEREGLMPIRKTIKEINIVLVAQCRIRICSTKVINPKKSFAEIKWKNTTLLKHRNVIIGSFNINKMFHNDYQSTLDLISVC